ncbi:hypothetical protein LB505_004948 [Fusarium chuoi]|nr:hypothetical protein LB505_004948 [Fusarium chuoi]
MRVLCSLQPARQALSFASFRYQRAKSYINFDVEPTHPLSTASRRYYVSLRLQIRFISSDLEPLQETIHRLGRPLNPRAHSGRIVGLEQGASMTPNPQAPVQATRPRTNLLMSFRLEMAQVAATAQVIQDRAAHSVVCFVAPHK